MKMILASSSPRRKELLQRLDHPFEIILPDVDESLLELGSNPEKYCITLAEMKTKNISQKYPQALVIGADTIVVLGGQILNKPDDRVQAENMLSMLSGQTHQTYTGVCLKWMKNNIHHTFSEITMVTFRTLDKKDILHYIVSCPPYDKAGSYGIQDWSAVYVKNIQGCYDNVVGLPLSRFYHELKKMGINLLDSISESS
jgi:septum formation protein